MEHHTDDAEDKWQAIQGIVRFVVLNAVWHIVLVAQAQYLTIKERNTGQPVAISWIALCETLYIVLLTGEVP